MESLYNFWLISLNAIITTDDHDNVEYFNVNHNFSIASSHNIHGFYYSIAVVVIVQFLLLLTERKIYVFLFIIEKLSKMFF